MPALKEWRGDERNRALMTGRSWANMAVAPDCPKRPPPIVDIKNRGGHNRVCLGAQSGGVKRVGRGGAVVPRVTAMVAGHHPHRETDHCNASAPRANVHQYLRFPWNNNSALPSGSAPSLSGARLAEQHRRPHTSIVVAMRAISDPPARHRERAQQQEVRRDTLTSHGLASRSSDAHVFLFSRVAGLEMLQILCSHKVICIWCRKRRP